MESFIYDFIINDNWRQVLAWSYNNMIHDLPLVIIGAFMGIMSALALWFQLGVDYSDTKTW